MDEIAPAIEPAESMVERSYSLKHDFGDVDGDQSIPGTIEFKNEDDEPIVLAFSRTSCGCLGVRSMPQRLEPGETGVFEVNLDTTGRRGLQQLQAIFWDTEPKKCLVTLRTTAMIRSCWTTPETLSLGNLVAGDRVKKELFVVVAGYPDASVLSVSTDAEWITLNEKEVVTEPRGQAVGIKAIGCYEAEWNGNGALPGTLSAEIAVRIEADEEQTLNVPVKGFLSGDVVVIPGQLVFGLIGKTEVVRSCTLRFNHPVDVAGVRVAAEHSSIKVELAKDENVPNQLVITARAGLPEEMSIRLLQGNIMGVDAEGATICCVPYTGVVNITN
ncbi:MAG: DUF1573 domain-containing protein [Planctomycetes bacterium]|nr:DUF1573 domain-containing protein [Planctomycetota bacterium]